MATSRSGDDGGWRAGASVFSGRVDPSWSPSEEEAGRALAVWAGLQPWPPGEPPTPPALGYRGSFLRSAHGEEWAAFGGAVTQVGPGGAVEVRADPERRFEKLLLASAPEGALPRQLLPS